MSRRRELLLLAVLALPPGVGCPRPEMTELVAEIVERPPPPETSAGTLQRLGPHLYRASFHQLRDGRLPLDSERMIELRWQDQATHAFEQRENEQLQGAVYRYGGDQFRLQHATWRRTASSGSADQLHATVDLWRQATGPFGPQLAFSWEGEGEYEGRATHEYRIELAPFTAESPDDTPERRARRAGIQQIAVELDGRLVIDAETGNRLLAEFEGALEFIRGETTTRISYSEFRGELGQDQEILVPAQAQLATEPDPEPGAPPQIPRGPRTLVIPGRR